MTRLGSLARVLISASRLDPLDVCYMEASERSQIWTAHKPDWRHKSKLLRASAFVRATLRAHLRAAPPPRCRPGDIVFLAYTVNQHIALDPIIRHAQEQGLPVATWLYGTDCRPPDDFNPASHRWAWLYLPQLLTRLLSSRGHQWRTFDWALDRYWITYGLYVHLRLLLKSQKPSVLVISNDHTRYLRTLIVAAAAEGIATVYVPHAAVTDKFPALSMDYAFLDGTKSLHAYRRAGPTQTAIFITGNVKLDRYISSAIRPEKVRRIAVCINLLDDPELCKPLIETLQSSGYEVCLRVHPGFTQARKSLAQTMTAATGAEYSDGTEPALDFIMRFDALLACDSGVLLEAALLKRVSVYYDFSGRGLDYYGFCRDGLCERVASPQHLLALLKAPPNWPAESLLRRYSANYEQSVSATELVTRLLDSLRREGTPNHQGWKRVDDPEPQVWEWVG